MRAELYHYSTWGNGPRTDQLAEVDTDDGACVIPEGCDAEGWHVLVIPVPQRLTRTQAIAWLIDGGLAAQS